MLLSKLKQSTKAAYEFGYRIINGECANPKGKILTGTIQSNGYRAYGVSINKLIFTFRGHQLAAYQKYGDKWLYSELIVRHLDGNKLNNKLENIAIGTHKDNFNDISQETKNALKQKFLKQRVCPTFNKKRRINSRKKRAKCSDEKVLEILKFYYIICKKNIQKTKVAKHFNLTRNNIYNILSGKLYKDIFINFLQSLQIN